MTESGDRPTIYGYLAAVTLGNLVAQMLAHQGIKPEDAKDHPKVAEAAVEALTNLGIHPGGLAQGILAGLMSLHLKPENVNACIDEFANVLWAILGDPESGSPPALYRKAAYAMHSFFMGLLDPENQ